ncbi:NACHT domain-containing protein [Krasilnikovia sp. MM14-A1259]|uniref:NACHT domain-containing protein n=1 Tax=Krasilnikovia sp. MM14-A1259 TaxID=3373539 RepID=UPI00399CF0E9
MVQGPRGGVANEAGSAHRRGVAAVLAAHGLAGRSVTGEAAARFVPVRVAFETEQATDDLTCRSADGATMFISAKRTCGNDQSNLGSTVAQWVAQAATLTPGDLLVLATAELRGDLRGLPGALARRRRAPGTPPSAAERDALTALTGRIAEITADPTITQRILDAAFVLIADAVEAGDHGFELSAALLEGTVVEVGAGSAAVRALSEAFHTQAGKAYASGLDDWLETLRDAKLRVIADGRGAAGAAAQARQTALQDYRRRLAEQAGVVDLALLAEDLPPLIVAGLADGLRVTVHDHLARPQVMQPLLVVARRWPRLLLTGLPGMGKSTALRQLAACWAADPRALLPIMVRLPVLADRYRQVGEVTAGMLCEVASLGAPAGGREDLAAALQQQAEAGHVVLLLDALDECGAHKAALADGLDKMLAGMPPEVGVILTTRGSAVTAAARLHLPAAELEPPKDLDDILDRMLQHIAHHRITDPQLRDRWTATRRSWIRATRRDHRDISDVPLLATLLTLVVAQSRHAPLTHSPAHVLHTAVEHSILRWERQRPNPLGERSGEPSPRQLLDGFAALGNRLIAEPVTTHIDAADAVAAMLAARWNVTAPGPAAELTEHIMRFWDHHVGVFVELDDGTVVPRSQLFAELGAAIAATWLSPEQLTALLSSAFGNPDRLPILLMIGQVDTRVVPILLTDAGMARPSVRALTAAKILRIGHPPGNAHQPVLLDLLATALEEETRLSSGRNLPKGVPGLRTVTPQLWPCLLELARMPLPAGPQRTRRDSLLDQYCVLEEEQVVAFAHAALADATIDDSPLNHSQVWAVRAALAFRLPDEPDPLTGEPRRGVTRSGRPELATMALPHLDVLGGDMAQHLYDTARLGRSRSLIEVEETLTARGHRFTRPGLRWGAYLPSTSFDLADLDVRMLTAIARLSDDPAELSRTQRWRLPDLGAFSMLIDAGEVTIGQYESAMTTGSDQTRIAWLRAAATAAGLEHAKLAAQAIAALADIEHGDDVRDLTHVALPGPAPLADPSRLGPQDRQALITALSGDSDWIAESACHLLAGPPNDGLRDNLLEMIPTLPATRRAQTSALACHLSTTPAATIRLLFTSTDPTVRSGAAHHLRTFASPAEELADLRTTARTDPNLSVRQAAGVTDEAAATDPPPPSRWLCTDCATTKEITTEHCQHCRTANRPGLH